MIASMTVFMGLAVWQAAVWIWVVCLALIVPSIFADPKPGKAKELVRMVAHLGICFAQLYLVHVLREAWAREQSILQYLLIVGCLAVFVIMARRWFIRGLRKMKRKSQPE